jgi:hypothetical protein
VVGVADQEHGVARGGVAPHCGVHARDERTDRVDRAKPPPRCPLVHRRLDAVGGENEQCPGGRLFLRRDEDGSALFELAHDVGVVDDLAADVDRRAVKLECSLYGLHGPLDAGAIPAGRGEKQPRNHGR